MAVRSFRYTAFGSMLSHLFLQPERIAGGEYNVRSDVWSTGISLLELVQNRFPYPSDLPPMEIVLMIRNGEVGPPLLSLKKNLN